MIDNYSLVDRLHPYPAKYTIEMIENYILKYTNENDLILDPFVGSGTTLLASRKHNRSSIGFDINPIAYHISKVKTFNYNKTDIDDINKILDVFRMDVKLDKNINEELLKTLNIEIVDYTNVNHWFRDNVIYTFSYIRSFTEQSLNEKVSYFLQLILSLITIEFSNQESDTRYAAMDKGLVSSSEILKKYILRSEKNLEILANLNYSKNIHKVYLENSKLINEIVTSDVDMIITSPPYPNTYDYYLYHKHRMLWLGYDFKSVMNNEIGSRREFSSLKKPVSNFTNDLFQILCSCDKVLKKNGHVLIIIGDGVVNGTKYNSNIETKKIAKRLGWIIIDEKYTELDKTSKKFQSSFRKKGKKEHYLLFRKV